MEVHRQYNLRSKKTNETAPKKTETDIPSTSQPKYDSHKENSKKHDAITKEIEKPPTYFSIENELVKVKNYIPLTELINKKAYISQVIKGLKIREGIDTINLDDD